MAVPAAPSVGSRALFYYSYATPAAVVPTAPAPGGGSYSPVPSGIPADCGPAGVALPAVVLSLGGAAPDYQGMQLLVHTPTGGLAVRSANFTSGQPLLNFSTWTTNGSNALQARWQLMDALE